MIARRWASDLLDFLLPTGCVSCGAWIPTEAVPSRVCARCRGRLKAPSWPRCDRCHHPLGTGRGVGAAAAGCVECRDWPVELTRARYSCTLTGPAADLVHALKYEGWAEVAGDVCDVVMTTLERHVVPAAGWAPAGATIVVPMPTTPRRERERGYNQAFLLARRVATRTGLPLHPVLRRLRGAKSQTDLSPSQRRQNVRGVFSLAPIHAALPGADVLLIDDVLTTGATASEAAVALTRGGAAAVTLVAFARATPPRPGSGQ